LSENDDANEKERVSDNTDERDYYVSSSHGGGYEAISAPVKRVSEIRTTNKPASANKLSKKTGKMSIDSMTELSSPFDTDSSNKSFLASSSVNNKDEDEIKRSKVVNNLKTGKISKTDANYQLKAQ